MNLLLFVEYSSNAQRSYCFAQTTTAGSIAFGFVHQCRSLSRNCKVLATAFSNVGADNLAESFLSLGLKVVRVGKPSGVSESLWDHTLEAAIQRDPYAQKAVTEAARISAKVKKVSNESNSRRSNKGSPSAERAKRDAVTTAVKESIQVRLFLFSHLSGVLLSNEPISGVQYCSN